MVNLIKRNRFEKAGHILMNDTNEIFVLNLKLQISKYITLKNASKHILMNDIH